MPFFALFCIQERLSDIKLYKRVRDKALKCSKENGKTRASRERKIKVVQRKEKESQDMITNN